MKFYLGVMVASYVRSVYQRKSLSCRYERSDLPLIRINLDIRLSAEKSSVQEVCISLKKPKPLIAAILMAKRTF